jgi:hypothetical protein
VCLDGPGVGVATTSGCKGHDSTVEGSRDGGRCEQRRVQSIFDGIYGDRRGVRTVGRSRRSGGGRLTG